MIEYLEWLGIIFATIFVAALSTIVITMTVITIRERKELSGGDDVLHSVSKEGP